MQNRLTIKRHRRTGGARKSTVSRVLNNKRRKRTRTRRRVEAVMNRHAFQSVRPCDAGDKAIKVVAIIVTRLDSLSENLAVQTMPYVYEQGYDLL